MASRSALDIDLVIERLACIIATCPGLVSTIALFFPCKKATIFPFLAVYLAAIVLIAGPTIFIFSWWQALHVLLLKSFLALLLF